jgi:hypothetical protein
MGRRAVEVLSGHRIAKRERLDDSRNEILSKPVDEVVLGDLRFS